MKKISLVFLCLFAIGCSSGSSYRAESAQLSQVYSVGNTNTANMGREELHAKIVKSQMEGALTAEQARIAHMQLDVKGHLTAEQIAMINRDRLAARHEYESNKETLDVLRDVTRSGSSMVSDVRDVRYTIQSIFR